MERITLQINGLPREVEIGKTYHYFIRLLNDETHPVTVTLKSSDDNFVYGVTIPPSSREDVEITGKFKDIGEWELTFMAMKNGVILDTVAQLVKTKIKNKALEKQEVKIKRRPNKQLDTAGQWIKLKNTVAVIFLLTLSQVAGAILLIFALIRLGTWLNFISFPWLDGWPEVFIWFIPWEAIVGFFGFCFLLLGLFGNGFGKGMITALFSITICLVIMFNTMPNFFQVVFWSGENGERMEETLEPDFMTNIIGGDGHRIWLHNNPEAENPSWEELMNFLYNDRTDQHPYVIGSFVCADFAETLHNNAEKAGIRAAYVSVDNIHALNAFNTTDKGMIFIDDGGLDTLAQVAIGEQYTLEPIWQEDRTRLVGVTVNVGVIEDVQVSW